MRFNELLAGVRGDLAVKVFGEDFDPMLQAANQIARILRDIDGAQDVRVEQATGLPFLEIKIDKAELARLGLRLFTVQDVIGAAIGGRDAGVVFEGDRAVAIIVVMHDVDIVAALHDRQIGGPIVANPAIGDRAAGID